MKQPIKYAMCVIRLCSGNFITTATVATSLELMVFTEVIMMFIFQTHNDYLGHNQMKWKPNQYTQDLRSSKTLNKGYFVVLRDSVEVMVIGNETAKYYPLSVIFVGIMKLYDGPNRYALVPQLRKPSPKHSSSLVRIRSSP